MRAPLNAPMPTAIAKPTSDAIAGPRFKFVAAAAEARAIMDPTERSMPPVATTSVIPIATSILVSVILTVVLNLVFGLFGRR